MAEKLTRQQIYDRIRETSKDSYILEEMQRLGFWENSPKPSLPEQLIGRETALNKELQELLSKDRRYQNPNLVLKEMRQERMKKAKERREETKQRCAQKRTEKAAQWQALQEKQIIYLGQDVSPGLHATEHDTNKLQQAQLPVFADVATLANAMQVDLKTLRYLLYNRKVSRISHYHTFEIPKKTGGKRLIAAPKKKLKALQRWVLAHILEGFALADQVHGFRQAHSIQTNALPHVGKDVVINLDLQNFFPTISYARVKGLFGSFGYSEQFATLFALICTQAETETVVLDGITYYVQQGNRFLPQGSPASPMISNLIAYKMDRRLQGLAAHYQFTYTRYADDLTFSATANANASISSLLRYVRQVVQEEGFVVHPNKTHVMRQGSQQKVTGLVVNQKTNIERSQLRRFRALMHQLETNGWNNELQWGKAKHLVHAIEGYIHFVHMVNPQKAAVFKEQFQKIVRLYGYPAIEAAAPTAQPLAGQQLPLVDTPTAPAGDWWDLLS